MHFRRRLVTTVLLLLTLVASGCTRARGDEASQVVRSLAPSTSTTVAATSTTTSTAVSTTSTTVRVPTTRAAPKPTTPPTSAPPPTPRTVHEQEWTPFATAGALVLHHPSSRVERVGFHESNQDGAVQLEVLATAADPVTLEGRDRGTGSRTAADVVVDPAVEIRAPVTGHVVKAGTYVLYCHYSDAFVIIEPDDRPGWEVKVLHINGVLVSAGNRVVAGETAVAPGPTRLPFPSQVEELGARPPWPHVHIEVVDPSIPDRPSKDDC